MKLLKFSDGNAKLPSWITCFSLPAGYSCPGALHCMSSCNPKTGKIQDGPKCHFRCSAAFAEALYPVVRKARWHNFDLLTDCKSSKQITELLGESLPNSQVVRPGISGDFYSQSYFDSWMNVAREFKDTLFYAYTKSIPLWLKRKSEIPKNFVLTASYGGRWDHLIQPNGLKYVRVVYSPEEAKALKLEIDHDDSHAQDPKCKKNALLLHSMQPAGSEACKAYTLLKKRGIAGYGTNKKARLTL